MSEMVRDKLSEEQKIDIRVAISLLCSDDSNKAEILTLLLKQAWEDGFDSGFKQALEEMKEQND